MTDLTQIRARLNTSHKLGVIDSRDDDIATLLREVERLQMKSDSLIVENTWLRDDAKRWRWVRENRPSCIRYHEHTQAMIDMYRTTESNEYADSIVDQAIAAQEKQHA